MVMPRSLLAAVLLGAASACGFAPLGWWPVTLVAVAALLILLRRAATARGAAALGWSFGLGQFCVGLNWIATAFTYQAAMPAWLGWVAVVLLSLYLAVYPALATAAAWVIGRRDPLALALAFSATWALGEIARATVFTGFAWNPLGVIWVGLPVAQGARLVGTYGLGTIAILGAGAVAALPSRRCIEAGVLAALPLAAAAYGLRLPPPAGPDGVSLRVVQPNIGQDEKWRPGLDAAHFARLAALTGPPSTAPRLILWPEVAIPDYLEEEPAARARIAALLGPRDLLLTGGIALQRDAGGEVRTASNSVFGLDASGRLLGRYDKSHLVPYGEYLPMRPLLSSIGLSRLAPGDMDFRAGPGPRDIVLPGLGPVGVQVCYEIIFSGQVIDEAHRPRFLFNPSNDAWFGRWGPPQHLAQARLRAIEEGLPVVRATPTGISAIIRADGALAASVPWRTMGTIIGRLPPVQPPTAFARWGNRLPVGLALVLVLAAIARNRPLRPLRHDS